MHPTKGEVRFLEQSFVHEVVRRAIGEALGQGRSPELQLRPIDGTTPLPAARALPGVVAGAGGAASRWGLATSSFRRGGPLTEAADARAGLADGVSVEAAGLGGGPASADRASDP